MSTRFSERSVSLRIAMRGRGITVALIDSGLHPSRAFAYRIKAFYDFTGGQAALRYPFDDYGHGTHVAGLIGGQQNVYDSEFEGVAPGVEFVVLKVLDGTGRGNTSDVIRAIDFATAHAGDDSLGIDVINLSLGHPIFEPAETDPLVLAVEAAAARGILVVTSAGNFGSNPVTRSRRLCRDQLSWPTRRQPSPWVPSTIKTRCRDTTIASPRYSSRGPSWYDGYAKPDVVAPGHALVSEAAPGSALVETYPNLRQTGDSGKTFLRLSGTSMAAGVTSGVVAMMQQAALENGSRLTPNLAKAILQFSAIQLADDQGSPYDVLTQGTGGVNADGALQLASNVDLNHADLSTAWTELVPCGMPGSECTSNIGDEQYTLGLQHCLGRHHRDWRRRVLQGRPLGPQRRLG